MVTLSAAVMSRQERHLKLEEGISGSRRFSAGCDHHILVPTQHLLQQTLQHSKQGSFKAVCNVAGLSDR